MKICVYGSASGRVSERFKKIAYELGEKIAKRGHSLVYGAVGAGIMGAVARGVKSGGGAVHGVIPEFFHKEDIEKIFEECDKITYTATMSERKKVMEDEAEAFIIAPGGIGTLEEFFEILTLKQLLRHQKAIAIYDIDGYFNSLESFMDSAAALNFITDDCKKLYFVADNADEILNGIENYKPHLPDLKKLKVGD